jgi:RNA polymerase sigma factor (sigma-70 family)
MLPEVDDLALLDRWQQGDQRAGQDLCKRYFSEVHRFFEYKILDEADDLTQQTFMACVRCRDQFRRQSSFRTYLYAIARNELYMRLRKMPRFEQVDLEVSSLNEIVSSPSQRFGQQEELSRVRAALRELPVEQQLLLELHYWHDLEAAALAEVFDTTPGAIRVRLLRARRSLRARMADVAGDTGDPLSQALSAPEVDDHEGD